MKNIIRLTRIHVPVGRDREQRKRNLAGAVWLTFAAIYIFLIAAQVSPAYGVTRVPTPISNASASAPVMLVSARGGSDHTDVMLSALPSAESAVNVTLDQCQQPSIPVAPNGSAYVRDFPTLLCVKPDHFRLTPAPSGVKSFAVVSIGNSTFAVPPVGAVDSSHPTTVRDLVNEEAVKVGTAWYIGAGSSYSGAPYQTQAEAQARAQQTRLTTFTEGSLAVDVYGPDGIFIATERWVAPAGLDQHELQHRFRSGYIVIRVERPGFGPCSYCADGGTVYGLVTVATAANNNSRSYPFGQ